MEIATLELTAYQAVAVAAIVLLLGRFLCSKINFLNTYCIPAPVVGGLVFAIVNLIGYTTGIGYITFDNTFQTFFMTVFFCSVGFTACFRLLKTGGIQVIIFLAVAIVLVLFQDVLGTALASVFGLDARLGLCMGSIPLVGGHGTSGSFGPLLESLGVSDANAVALAAATFGLVAGSVIGGPIARARIKQKNLHSTDSGIGSTADNGEEVAKKTIDNTSFVNAALYLAVAIGIGTLVYDFFTSIHITFPTYIGAMLLACILRNATDAMHIEMPLEEIDCLGNLSLNLFLSLALMSLKLWQLAALALPMIVILLLQTVFMAFFAYFVVFKIMGSDYEASCFAAATCGFGMGATPNAMANIQAVNKSFGPSPRALFVVPLVGSLFIDFFNSIVITTFLNFLG